MSVAGRHLTLKFFKRWKRTAGEATLVNVMPRRGRRGRRFALCVTQSVKNRWRFFQNSLRNGFQTVFEVAAAAVAAATGVAGVAGGHFGTTFTGFFNGEFHIFHAVENVV